MTRVHIQGMEESKKLAARLFAKHGRRGLGPKRDSFVRDSDLKRLKRDYGVEPNAQGYFVFFKTVERGRSPFWVIAGEPEWGKWRGVYKDGNVVTEDGVNRNPLSACAEGINVVVSLPVGIQDETCLAVLVHKNDVAVVPWASRGGDWCGSRKIRVRRLRVLERVRRRVIYKAKQ